MARKMRESAKETVFNMTSGEVYDWGVLTAPCPTQPRLSVHVSVPLAKDEKSDISNQDDSVNSPKPQGSPKAQSADGIAQNYK